MDIVNPVNIHCGDLVLRVLIFSGLFYLRLSSFNLTQDISLKVAGSEENPDMEKLLSVDFEVYGHVQDCRTIWGVLLQTAQNLNKFELVSLESSENNFTACYTQQESRKLGLKGWCMNTERGTVQGVLEGKQDKIEEMKHWLQTTGSPMSRIEKAVFRNIRPIVSYSFQDFKIRR